MARKTNTVLAMAVVAVGIALTAFLGLWGYMAATPPLHPNAQDIQSVAAAEPSPRWAEAVAEARQVVRAALAEQSLPGVSAAVAIGPDIVWAEGFGWADLVRKVPVSPNTQFRIGTASVALTSAAAGLLLEQKRLFLDDEIQRHVPQYPEHQWPVTVRQLMGHVAGVPNDGGDEGPLLSQRCDRPVDALQHLSGYERELAFEPGTRFQYSSYGWILVSAAIEAAAGEPFLAFMRKSVFDPLGMKDTVADSATEAMPERATPYFPRFAADPRYGLHPMRPLDYSCYAGAGVFLSTPSDLLRFAMAIENGKLLQPDTVRVLRTPQRLASGEEIDYGLGWDLETVTLAGKQTPQAGHDGDLLGGRAASLLTYPEHGIAVSVIANIPYVDTAAIGLKIADAFARRK
jgi:serine beta-lactamase-like protein LACTB, mitochondrial